MILQLDVSSDDETPDQRPFSARRPPSQRRPASIMGGTQRDLIGEAHRQADAARRRSGASPLAPIEEQLGVPLPAPEEEVTKPHEMLERELRPRELEVVRRSSRDTDSPAIYADVVKIAEKLYDLELADVSNRRLAAAHRDRDPTDPASNENLDKRLGVIEGRNKTIAVVLFVMFGGGGGWGYMLLQKTMALAEEKGAMVNQVQHLTEEVNRLRDRMYSPAAERPWLNPSTKDAP